MDIVLISGGSRPDFLEQTIESMLVNSLEWSRNTLTVVLDGCCSSPISVAKTVIINRSRLGASASRNIGAGSIPKYKRQNYVMFCDDDCYFCPGWDSLVINTLDGILAPTIVSGHAHPFNLSERRTEDGIEVDVPLLVSTVHMAMPWELWDKVGYFVEPGGPGGSEDYDYCMRAKKFGIGFAVTVPQCVIHCGLTSSAGKKIVGYDMVTRRNNEIIDHYGIYGKVHFE